MGLEANFQFDMQLDNDGLLKKLLTLPDSLKPTRIGPDEIVGKDWIKINEADSLLQFYKRFPCGFFLKTDTNILYMFNRSETDSELYIDGIDALSIGDIHELINCLASLDPVFGYACDDEEYCHRNRIYHTFDGGSSEGWVGRDINRYIPGLYWKTLISRRLLKKHNVVPTDVGKCGFNLMEMKGRMSYLFTGFDAHYEWHEHASEIDVCCERLDGIFSINEAKIMVRAAKGIWGLSSITEKFR